MQRFKQAMQLAGSEFLEAVTYAAKASGPMQLRIAGCRRCTVMRGWPAPTAARGAAQRCGQRARRA